MRLTILRHAVAVDKRSWTEADVARPLDERGRSQAAALVPVLTRHTIRRIVSSPAVRCTQTVEPLAEQVGLDVERWDDLGRDGHATRIVTACFGDPAFDDAVICTHGELIQPLLGIEDVHRLVKRRRLRRDRLLKKGTAWRLRIDAGGTVRDLEHLVPDER